MELINKSGLEFVDISIEEWREYRFPNGDFVKIEHPLKIHVSKKGHRIFDANGISHYIPRTFIHLKWKGTPNFIF